MWPQSRAPFSYLNSHSKVFCNSLCRLEIWFYLYTTDGRRRKTNKKSKRNTHVSDRPKMPSSLSTVRIPLIPGERITHNPLPFLPCCFLPWGTTLWWHKSSYSPQQKAPSLTLSPRNHLQTCRHPHHLFLSPFPLAIFSFDCLHTVCQGANLRGWVWKTMTFPLLKNVCLVNSRCKGNYEEN